MNPFHTKGKDFDTIYQRYADRLYRLAFSYLNHREDAEDVVQEVFTKYMCRLHLFMDSEHEKAWLIRVTINQCHDVLRKRKYRLHDSLEDIKQLPEEKKETGLQEALQFLPEKYKDSFLLYYFEGYSVEETAKLLRISVSAVKMRLKRGRVFLKGILERE